MSNEFGFYRLICQVRCGKEFGNGFLVAPDLVLTADHIIEPFFNSGTGVEVCFENEDPIRCNVLSSPESPSIPLVVLQLPSTRKFDSFYVGSDILSEGALVSVCGFPSSCSISADKIDLKYVRPFETPISNCNTEFKPLDERRESFKGFSGSPVFANGHVIGIVLEQKTDNHVANRVMCLCGVDYRNKLSATDIVFHLCNVTSESSQFTKIQTSVLTDQVANHDIISELDMLIDERFQPIKEARANGEIEKSKLELRIFLERLSSMHCSDAKKAECYYQGAIQLLLDHETDDAEHALQAAKVADSGLDDSVYRAYALLRRGLPEQARECLGPVDSEIKLDAYFSCLIAQKAELSEFKLILQATGISPSWQSLRLLAIAALRSNCFEGAHRYVQDAREKGHNDPHLPIVEALIFYWEALCRTYPDVDRTGFAIADNLHFIPDRGQVRSLEQAYELLYELYKSNVFSDIETRSLLAWALLAVSAALPGKDYSHWLEEFRTLRPLDPIDIIFCTNNRITIPDGIRNGFLTLPVPEQNGGCHAYARYRLLLSIGQLEEARETFSAHLVEIASYYKCPTDICQLQMLLDTKDCQSANKLLKKVRLSLDEKNRFDIAIQFQLAPKAFNRLVKQAVDFARSSRESIDYGNALTICKFYKKWDSAVSTAKEWWATTGELVALEAYVEALFMKRKYKKCLGVIKKAENVGDDTVKMKQYKMNALLVLAKTTEAREVARELGEATANPRLAVLEAQTFITEGQPQQAINVLRSYADKDLYDFEVYQLLAELLKGEHPDLAFRYAELMYHHDPENIQVLQFAGNIALLTGHDDSELAGRFILQLNQGSGKGGFGQAVTIEEAIKIFHEVRERQAWLENEYKDRKLPIHLFADGASDNLGGIIYSVLGRNIPYLGRFGVPKDIEINFRYPLVLDYSSCLILYKIGHLETMCSWFADVWIDQHLLEIWLNDINQLKSVQTNVVQKVIQLSDAMKSLHFECHSSDDRILRTGINHVLLHCAKNTGAILVSEGFESSSSDEPVPEDWNEISVHPHTLYAVLDYLRLPHPDYNDSVSLEESIAKVTPQCKLVLNQVTLDELLSAGALEDVFYTFHIVLPTELVSSIHNQADSYRNRNKAAKWLEEAYSIVGRLLSQGKITLKPSISSKEQNTGIYCQLYIDEFKLVSSNQSTLVIDDCFGNRYRQINRRSGNSPIISSYDLITLAYQSGKLNENEYYRVVDQLLSCGYGFFVPPPKYMFSRLCLSDIDDQGILNENPRLRNLRWMFAYAFDKDMGPRCYPGDTYTWPELVGFIDELGNTFRDCLVDVWDSKHKLEWKRAASDWLLAFAGDFICDIERFNSNADDFLASKQATLLFVKALRISPEKISEFANWLDPYLIASWWANPSFVPKAVEEISQFIQTTLLDRLQALHKKEAGERVSIAYICNLPYLIRPLVIKELARYPHLEPLAKIMQEDERRISQLGDIQDCIEGTFVLDKAKILCGDEEAMDAAICFILANVQAHSEAFIREFPIDSMSEVPDQANYTLARFLANLAWYFPPSMRAHLHELKRKLSSAPTPEN